MNKGVNVIFPWDQLKSTHSFADDLCVTAPLEAVMSTEVVEMGQI